MSAVTKSTSTTSFRTMENHYQEKTQSASNTDGKMPKLSQYRVIDITKDKDPHSMCFSCYQAALKTFVDEGS